MFPNPFSIYLINTPSISAFMKSHQEYLVFEKFLDHDNLEELLRNIFRKFNPSVEFVKNYVNVMSIHKSKGLQADHVFISGLVDGVLPNQIRGLDTIEAQRRLLFVGMNSCHEESLFDFTG